MSKEFYKVPLYVTGNSKNNLIRAMIENNKKYGTTFSYFQIQKEGKEWIAWYLGNAINLVEGEMNDRLSKKGNRG